MRVSYTKLCAAMMIRTKSQGVIPFQPNPLQLRYRAEKARNARESAQRGVGNRTILLKHRQWGGSTEEQAQSLFLTGTIPGMWACLLAPTEQDALALFASGALVMYRGLVRPAYLVNGKPALCFERKTENAAELNFEEADSKFYTASAEQKVSGHGRTIQKVHLSEFARYEPNRIDEVWTGLLPTVPIDGEIVVESTANGTGGRFHEEYQKAKERPGKPWWPIFFRWFEDAQYSHDVTGEEEREILRQVQTGQGHDYAAEEQNLAQRLARDGIVLTAGQWAFRRAARYTYSGRFFELYPEDDVSCFLTSGRPFFDPHKLDLYARSTAADAPGAGRPIRKEEHDDLWIWADPKPGRRYHLSSDVAQGIEVGDNSDYSTITITDRETAEDQAEFMSRVGPGDLARLIDECGRRYNNATAVVERNGHGFMTLEGLKELHYPSIWMAEDGKPGWHTSEVSRAFALDNLHEMMMAETYIPRSPRFIGQARTFVTSRRGKPEAQSGSHDDLVICKAINLASLIKARRVYVSGFTF